MNYNTEFSGITKEILDPITNTIENTLHPMLSKLIKTDTILIGHSLENDFNAMRFYHPKVVDTSVLFRRKNGSKMKLKNLADKILNVTYDITIEKNSIIHSRLKRRLSRYITPSPSTIIKLESHRRPKIVPLTQRFSKIKTWRASS